MKRYDAILSQGNAYELQEIYGFEQSEESDNSKECVICMCAAPPPGREGGREGGVGQAEGREGAERGVGQLQGVRHLHVRRPPPRPAPPRPPDPVFPPRSCTRGAFLCPACFQE